MKTEYLILFFFLINLLTGLFVFLNEKNKKIGAHFLVSILILNIFTISLFYYQNEILLKPADWIRTIIVLAVIILFELLFLVISISNKSLKDAKVILVTFALLLMVIILAFFLNRTISTAPFPPPLVTIFTCLFLYSVWLGMIFSERILKTADEEHLQIISILMGFGVFVTFLVVFDGFIPLVSGKNFSWVNYVLPVFLTAFMGVTVGRNSFFKNKTIKIEFSLVAIAIFLLALSLLMPNYELKIITLIVLFLFCWLAYYSLKIISEQLKKGEQAESILKEGESLNSAKDQFILSFQHHLRTPLVPIKGYLEMILNGAYGREENPVIREKLIEIKNLANTLYSMIESLLDIQELRLGKNILNLEDCRINSLVESVVEELKPMADEKGLYLKFEKNEIPLIKLDKKRIRETIWNLIDNAIKYTNDGGITIAAEFEDGKLKIAVSDTGIGMEKEEIDHFLKGQLFERGEEAKKLYGPGRGIGLNLALEFIKAHGGTIEAQSKGRGKGSTFLVETPVKNF